MAVAVAAVGRRRRWRLKGGSRSISDPYHSQLLRFMPIPVADSRCGDTDAGEGEGAGCEERSLREEYLCRW